MLFDQPTVTYTLMNMLDGSERGQISQGEARPHAFTLIELLVVIAIIALLISILVPALGAARQQGKNAVCRSNEHQLGLAIGYYVQDNRDCMPFIRPKKIYPNDPNRVEYPFRQYDQIFNFWPYLKDMRIYKCPSVKDDNGAQTNEPVGGTGINQYDSFYTMLASDDYFLNAYQQNWWPGLNINQYVQGADQRVMPLYTEYWSNDWYKLATDYQGRPVPAVNGGALSKIPVPAYTVAMTDAVWWTDHLRHADATNIVFLDAHVTAYKKINYYDQRPMADHRGKGDWDAFQNRPFYVWGLRKYPEPYDSMPGD